MFLMNDSFCQIWSHWGDEQKEVRLCLRRVDNEADSGRGSPVGATPSLKRRRNRKNCAKKSHHPEGLHPRRLAELGGFNRDEFQEFQLRRLEAEEVGEYAYGEKTYATSQEAGHVRRKNGHRTCSGTGVLHSTAIESRAKKCCTKRSSRPKVRNSENIEKLMKLILAQGATIQTQLLKLKEREQQIENIEVERHKDRAEKMGRNYLLETYFASLKEAQVPFTDEEKGTDSGVHTEAGSEPNDKKERGRQLKSEDLGCERPARSKSETRCSEPGDKPPLARTQSANTLSEQCEPVTKEDDIVELKRVQSQVEMWEKVLRINKKLEKEEENLVKLHIQIRRIQSESITIAKDDSTDPIAQSLQKQLEALRSDLDTNSKEIYKNFTQLIQDDEKVVKKQNHLTELINDLQRTDHEHNMLTEMVSAVPEDQIGISLQVKGQEKVEPDLNTPQEKPKIVKISFDENIQSDVNVTGKDPSPTPTRSIKGILKNKKSIDLEKIPVNYGSNISSKEELAKIGKDEFAHPSTSFTAAMENPYEHLFPNIAHRREAIYHPATPPKNGCLPTDVQTHAVLVTTKAIIHNDTDSSGSSDTSGLSSMHSPSPTVEEATYVLNTLV